jgi:hypothetical protein
MLCADASPQQDIETFYVNDSTGLSAGSCFMQFSAPPPIIEYSFLYSDLTRLPIGKQLGSSPQLRVQGQDVSITCRENAIL